MSFPVFRTTLKTFGARTMSDGGVSWRGVPITAMYGSEGPWGAPEFPLISPAYNHTVLYHIPTNSSGAGDQVPTPQRGEDKWDHDYVRMPCSPHSLYPYKLNGEDKLKKRWEMIEEALQDNIENSHDLAAAILSYNSKLKHVMTFRGLHEFFNNYLDPEETDYFFTITLPEIVKLALALPHIIQAPIPLLKQHKNRAISLSQQQIASLLANSFFCTFPRRNSSKTDCEYSSYPRINFSTLYETTGSDSTFEKLKCLCHYFRRVCTKVPTGVMTFIRRSVPPRQCPDWAESIKLIAQTPLHVNSSGTIEDDGVGLMQVDFANKYLGGGVLNYGCVQEEIRFVICPELMASMLFTETLRPNEALLMIGCERYSKYSGYGNSFKWAGNFVDDVPFDSSGRRRCAVLAIDALPFNNKAHEYRREHIVREMNKAWVGMSICTSEEDKSPLHYPGVATGNWGCGAFGGSADLKSLLQVMAASEARRPVAYYTFNDLRLRDDLIYIYDLLSQHNVTVGQLYKMIMMFSLTDVRKSKLYPFIKQKLLDKAQAAAPTTPVAMDISVTSDTNEGEANNSPDLFSQDFDDSFNEETSAASEEKTEKGNSNSKSQSVDHADAKAAQNDNSKHGSNNSNNTSRLFEEMEKLDEESGKLNFKSPQKRYLGTPVDRPVNIPKLDKNRQSRDNVTSASETTNDEQMRDIGLANDGDDDDDSLSMNTSLEVKKKIGKKITDYFNKKT
ncbi:poly(ADP-ribose) glycohydrolase [Plutella xylostella]|uniref:poly(ADP-ribose) glycohydrolase n=1 Tax=Plutella xylostella TaxID=51655 RepID=UPI00203279C6|nr:poly(ADP-ribose) glycohydrolase [Plutella xylostella]